MVNLFGGFGFAFVFLKGKAFELGVEALAMKC